MHLQIYEEGTKEITPGSTVTTGEKSPMVRFPDPKQY